MEKVLTVVVPVYKVEKFINKCLDSLIVSNELMERIEVIIVNDGTPDGSAEMAKVYQKLYPQTFRVIDKENGGHGSAWNVGLKAAKGKYLRFLDSDDWLNNDNFVGLIHLLSNLDVDVVFSDFNTYIDSKQVEIRHCFTRFPKSQVIDADSFEWMNLEGGENATNFHHCTYRTSMLKPLCPLFLEHQFYDDSILFVLPTIMAKTIYYWDNVVYIYRVGLSTQTMNTATMLIRFRDFEKVIKSQIEFVKIHQVESEAKKKRVLWVVSTMIKKQWKRLSLQPYRISKIELNKLRKYLALIELPIEESRLMRFYRFVPFYVYWHYVNRKFSK